MATITSLSNNSSYGLNSKGIGGLATGLDTDEIMKGMTLGTRSRIAKQLQSKQLLAWQTDAYRSVSNKLINFSKKYTSYTSNTNLSSPTFYLQNDITTSGSNSSKVSVSGTSTMTESLSIISATQAKIGSIIVERDPSVPLKDKTMESSTAVDIANLSNLAGKSISFSYNNNIKTIAFDTSDLTGITTIDGFKDKIQNKLDNAFGIGKIIVNTNTDKLTFKTADTAGVLKVTTIDDASKAIIGLSTGDSNRLNISQKLTDVVSPADPVLNIGGGDLDLSKVITVQDLINKVNSSDKGIKMSYIESLDKFEFTSTKGGGEIYISGNVAEKLFGAAPAGAITVSASTPATMTVKYGDAAEIKLESNNDTFILDSLTIKVNESFSSGDAVKLSSKTDTTKVLTAVKDMVKDYNEMVDLVNSELSTKRNRNYAPLSDEQKEDMSESEIKVWEEKAKQGMLFGNNDMRSLSGDLRSVFFSSGSAMADLEALGISTSKDYRDNGKIIINEEKLKSAIDADPENIKKIFSDQMSNVKNPDGSDLLVNGKVVADTTSGGVMSRLQNLTTKYSKTEGSEKGILIEKAGNTSSPLSLTKNGLLDNMNNIDTIVTNLKRTLAAEQKRYQTQFTNLERVISRLNSQSSWLSQQ